jgi:8-oxo-dGTP diphosphatase
MENVINYVLGFAFDLRSQQTILIKKNKPKYLKGMFNGIGGKIEPKEDVVFAMVREFREETGLQTLPDDWEIFAYLNKPHDYFVWVFRNFNMQSAISFQRLGTETEEIKVFDLEALPFNSFVPNLKWLIPLALDKELTFKYSQMLATYPFE